jgi:hypothetical protein
MDGPTEAKLRETSGTPLSHELLETVKRWREFDKMGARIINACA